MLTLFTTAKPFRGHSGVIQRNALESWKRLHPDAEVILFGDEDGAAETARDLSLRHEPEVQRNQNGTKYLPSFFDRAQDIARHDTLCYANCDILLLQDLRTAVERVRGLSEQFLMVGRRWDTDIAESIDFQQAGWETDIRRRARMAGRQRPPQWVDYFVFSRGLYRGKIPPFVIGRPGWDCWLVWFARSCGVPVVDASDEVFAVHQNHDYSYHPQGERGVWEGEEAQRNYALLERGRCFCTIANATHRLTRRGFRKNYRHYLALAQRRGNATVQQAWFALLDVTRPLRRRLGLRSKAVKAAEDRRILGA